MYQSHAQHNPNQSSSTGRGGAPEHVIGADIARNVGYGIIIAKLIFGIASTVTSADFFNAFLGLEIPAVGYVLAGINDALFVSGCLFYAAYFGVCFFLYGRLSGLALIYLGFSSVIAATGVGVTTYSSIEGGTIRAAGIKANTAFAGVSVSGKLDSLRKAYGAQTREYTRPIEQELETARKEYQNVVAGLVGSRMANEFINEGKHGKGIAEKAALGETNYKKVLEAEKAFNAVRAQKQADIQKAKAEVEARHAEAAQEHKTRASDYNTGKFTQIDARAKIWTLLGYVAPILLVVLTVLGGAEQALKEYENAVAKLNGKPQPHPIRPKR